MGRRRDVLNALPDGNEVLTKIKKCTPVKKYCMLNISAEKINFNQMWRIRVHKHARL